MKVLVDTSIWIDHLRRADTLLVALLQTSAVYVHPFIVGELACGSLAQRSELIGWLQALPSAVVAHPDEVLLFIGRHELQGQGLGYVDMHLLASTALTCSRLWTRDRRLHAAARKLDCTYDASSWH